MTSKRRSRTLLIFVHGLTGYQNEHIFYNGARYFAERGINTFRFNLYSGERGGRTLINCGLSTHASDLNIVAKFFRKDFYKIFVAGHSLGGITVLLADNNLVDGIILWDSSFTMGKDSKKCVRYNKCLDAYLIRWGTEFLLGKKMYSEWRTFPKPRIVIARINKPIKIIVAGAGRLIKAGQEYFKYAKEPKEFTIIKGAGHNFNEDDTAQKLFVSTYSFIKKYS